MKKYHVVAPNFETDVEVDLSTGSLVGRPKWLRWEHCFTLSDLMVTAKRKGWKVKEVENAPT